MSDIENLKNDDPEIRALSAYTLGKLKDACAVEPLIDTLKDPELKVRQKAVEALGELRDQRAVEPLISLLKSGDECMKYLVIEAVGEIRDKRATGLLLDLFKVDKGEKMVETLGRLGDARAVEPLIALMLENQNRAQMVAYALWNIEDGKGISRLIELLYDKDDTVRALSAFALGCACGIPRGYKPDSRAVEPLMDLFLHDNARVRSDAIWALGKIKDERAGDLIIAAFWDEDEEVRKSAIQACAYFPNEDRRIYNALMKAANDPRVGESLREEMHRMNSL